MPTQKQEQYKFSLSRSDKHNREVKRIVGFMKKKGILSQAIRDGLRLLNDLRLGNTKVLLELFPDIVDQLCPTESPTDDISELKDRLRRLEERVHQQSQGSYIPTGNIPDSRDVGLPLMQPVPKMLAGANIALPPPDDDDHLEVNEAVIEADVNGMFNIVLGMMQ